MTYLIELMCFIADVFEDINYDDEHDAMDIEPSLSVFVSDDINMDYPSSPCMEDFLCSILGDFFQDCMFAYVDMSVLYSSLFLLLDPLLQLNVVEQIELPQC